MKSRRLYQGQTVKARIDGGIATGEIITISKNNVRIRVQSKTITENGESLTLKSDEERSILDHMIVETLN